MYEIRVWNINSDWKGKWRLWCRRKTKPGAVRVVRRLERQGYDRDTSIYVERIEAKS